MTTNQSQEQPTKDNPAPTYYEPKRASIATVQEHGQNDVQRTLPLQLSINFSIGLLVVLLFATAYYYGFLK
jgi:hypothetical protein